ncbi:hypothetical protein J437_LFUL017971 [Ladona fulva]|uniref:Alpha-tubulin N-acetyltransferase n=1 Tax=Ladona fulva TaxID=123851 RepID=A0A8K0PC62_LADFU|nr:hypothetical protein J437_LFUL017971 [Ladona fulva]
MIIPYYLMDLQVIGKLCGLSDRNCQENISKVIDVMGKASAVAQGLNVAITTGERLKSSDHTVYLLIDQHGKAGKGTVVGLLKTGRKKLYVFDETGAHHEIIPLCVLDFYVHESKQRMGCGRKLFEYMLQDENLSPGQLAIDRPSQKFIAFLYKHYGLKNIIPQMNNFVVFDVFFKYLTDSPSHSRITNNSTEAKHAFTSKSGIAISSCSSNSLEGESKQRVPEQYSWKAPLLAQRPVSSIGQILQHTANLNQQSLSSSHDQGMQIDQSTKIEALYNLPISINENTPTSSREHTPMLSRSAETKNLPQNTSQENGTQVAFKGDIKSTSPCKTEEQISDQDLENVQTTLTTSLYVQEYSDQEQSKFVKRDLKFHHQPLW